MVKVCSKLKREADEHKTLTARRERGESENCNSNKKSKFWKFKISNSELKLQKISCKLKIDNFNNFTSVMPP